MKVGDKAYIIESGRKVREVELVGVAGDGFIVKFVDTGGGICVNRSRLFKLDEVKKEDVPFKAKNLTIATPIQHIVVLICVNILYMGFFVIAA